MSEPSAEYVVLRDLNAKLREENKDLRIENMRLSQMYDKLREENERLTKELHTAVVALSALSSREGGAQQQETKRKEQ